MSRLKPCASSTTGAAGSPAARTASPVPSNDATGPRSSGGRSPSGSVPLPVAPLGHDAADHARREAGGDPGRDQRGAASHPTCSLGTRGPIRVTISYAIVPAASPSSAAVIVSPSCSPSSTTSSPGATSASPQIDHHLVHRHGARDAVAASPDQDLRPGRRRPRVPVRVADRHRRDRRGPLELVALAVAEALAGGQPLRHRHGRAPRQRRAEPPVLADPGGRHDPVERDPRAHEVERRLRMPQHRAAVRRVDEPRLDAGGARRLDDPREPVQLDLRHDLIVLAHRQMRPQTLDLEAGRDDRGEEPRRILGRPEPRPGACRCRSSRGPRPSPGPRPRAGPGRRRCTPWASGGAPSATASEPGGNSESTRIGASIPARRSSRPSSTSATPAHVAPASIAARATGTAPCP